MGLPTASCEQRSKFFLPGDCVRIRRGRLAGITAVVSALRPDGICALAPDGWPLGATVVISNSFVERIAARTLDL